ncbi:MAG: hypothetical protein ACREH4_01435 [Vitreimonas sp.]
MSASAQLERPRAKRIYIAPLFAVLGPAVGTFAMLAVLIGEALVGGDGDGLTTLLRAMPTALLLGYVYGSGPAALTGVAYALAPRGLQRIALSPLLGAIIVAVFFVVFDRQFSVYLDLDITLYGLLILSGVAAAFVCAAIARALKWDARSLEAARSSGAPQAAAL